MMGGGCFGCDDLVWLVVFGGFVVQCGNVGFQCCICGGCGLVFLLGGVKLVECVGVYILYLVVWLICFVVVLF